MLPISSGVFEAFLGSLVWGRLFIYLGELRRVADKVGNIEIKRFPTLGKQATFSHLT